MFFQKCVIYHLFCNNIYLKSCGYCVVPNINIKYYKYFYSLIIILVMLKI